MQHEVQHALPLLQELLLPEEHLHRVRVRARVSARVSARVRARVRVS